MKERLRLEVKEISEAGSFEGMLSPYGNIDGGDDIVEPGAYKKTLKEKGATRPLLWQHKSDEPIGEITLTDTPEGLMCSGQLLMDDPMAQKAHRFIKSGIVKGLSVGFETVKKSFKDGIRHLEEMKLYEGSIVTFPMNEQALITSVKARRERKDDFNEELVERQTMDAWYQMDCALDCALRSVLYSGMPKDEMLAAFKTVIQQYADAMEGFLPTYLDTASEVWGEMETWSSKRILERKERKDDKPTKRIDGMDLTADCFAYVGDPDKTETWHLPIKFPGDDEKTKSHIRNALARFEQTDIPESDRAAVLAKIHAAAKKHGIDSSDKAIDEYRMEAKSGAILSAATKSKIKAACMQIKAGHEDLIALIEGEAGDATSSEKAANPQETAEPKPEPDGHSAAETLIGDIRALIPA